MRHYRILLVQKGESKEYVIQYRKHLWSKWVEAPLIIRIQGHLKTHNVTLQDLDKAIFCKKCLEENVTTYKGKHIYPVFSLKHNNIRFIVSNKDYWNSCYSDFHSECLTISEAKICIDYQISKTKTIIKVIS